MVSPAYPRTGAAHQEVSAPLSVFGVAKSG